jgi:hypothetical protein
MHKFYFNDYLPVCSNQHTFTRRFSETLIEFGKLVNKDLAIENAVITEKMPSELFLGNTYTLQDTINSIADRDLKQLAFACFNKYPIAIYFPLAEDVVDRLFHNNYSLAINTYLHDALNIATVAEKGGFLFTVALHVDLKKDSFELVAQTDGSILMIDNLHGTHDNTIFIEKKIESLNVVNLSNIEKLKRVLGDYVFSNQFEKDFSRLNHLEQTSIIDDFEKAEKRKLLSPFYPDTKIIKDVTPDKPKCNVYELRVYTPTALRVYFNEYKSKVYVASIGFKSSTKQSEDIKNAHITLNKMILTA